MVRFLSLATAFVLAGCNCSPSVGEMCASDTDCSDGLVCRDGRCSTRPDGGIGGEDDAGQTCAASERCGGVCCANGEECVDDMCLPICASDLRCGPAMTCCADGQLCIDDACLTPGDACVDEIDCPVDSICVAGLDRCLPRGASRCEYFPPAGVFTPEQQWAWTGSTVAPEFVHVMMAPVVGDLDGDEIPEVAFITYSAVTSYGGPGVLRIVRGDTGVEVRSITDPQVCGEHGIALGDLEGDGTPEIVTGLSPCGAGEIAAFHLDGSLVWRSHNADGSPYAISVSFGGPSIADLEGDGRAEVVIGGAVIEADGTVRWSRNPAAGSGYPSTPVSAVYDMDLDGALDVVGGNAVWRADGTPIWENTALADGWIAIADFFADSTPDIAVVHDGVLEIRRGTTGEVIWGPIGIPPAPGRSAGRGGPPTIADFDGDDLPEIGIAGASAYSVFDPDGPMPVLWSRETQDESSNITGSSVFDFDGDGRAEVVYNDECFMRVYSGTDGTVLATVEQNSHTLIEYPLIVDVDADGNAEIVFAGNSAVNACGMGAPYTGLQAGIRVFRDAADNWVGTRPVWNQHTYHITNVRRDLSVPAPEQRNWQRYNNFRQNPQSFDAPNLMPESLMTNAVGCPPTLELIATIWNRGAATVGAGLPVTFYAGDPAGVSRAIATVRTDTPILPGSSVQVRASGALLDTEHGRGRPWFVRADDAGAGTGENNECIETDNVATSTYDCVGIE